MSRIGKKPIELSDGVTVALNPGLAKISGPKGTLEISIHPEMVVKQEEKALIVERPSDSAKHRSLHGTTRQLLANTIQGVSSGFTKELEIIGVGYQANMQGNRLVLQLGYSHDILFDPPEGITITANRTEITISGADKQLVGEVAAKIRSFRKPEPYKGKGVRYKGEYVRHKQGKKVGA